MHSNEETFSFHDIKAIFETDKGLKCVRDGEDEEPFWVPKGQIHEDSEVYKTGTEGELIVSAWWAGQRGYT